jgi:hypothetical protein
VNDSRFPQGTAMNEITQACLRPQGSHDAAFGAAF